MTYIHTERNTQANVTSRNNTLLLKNLSPLIQMETFHLYEVFGPFSSNTCEGLRMDLSLRQMER